MKVTNRDGILVEFNSEKVKAAIEAAFKEADEEVNKLIVGKIYSDISFWDEMNIEDIQDQIIEVLSDWGYDNVAREFLFYRWSHEKARELARSKQAFINRYKNSSNTANATIDDNSNVGTKNIGVLNAEGHKQENVLVSRVMVKDKIKELYPDFDAKQYVRDLKRHIIYKHDESGFMGAIAPYCCSISMYPFLQGGIKGIGGLSARPENIDSYCGMYINLIFAVSSQFAGAVATPEFLLYFDYFARKQWGDEYYTKPDVVTTSEHVKRTMTIRKQIHQYFQQVIYSINQPAAARGMQSAFVNFAYFDKPFFEAMFSNFMFPDMSEPKWDSLNWLQKEFMQWFNKERERTILTFPVESFALIYKDGKFVDEDNANFVAEEYARGHSFFTYISDTADSLSSCCRLKNKVDTKEFNFTNGNMGVETGSKSVITLNLNRIIQDWACTHPYKGKLFQKGVRLSANPLKVVGLLADFKIYLRNILSRVYKYHIAYNECLWDMYDAGLLPVYSNGFISLNKQYLTIGLNGLNQAAEFLGIDCNVNADYEDFCQTIFGIIKESNTENNGKYFGHKVTFNTECVPAESLAAKNYNWDKEDGYWVPTDTNLYASYIFKPNDKNISILDKFVLHGRNYIGDFLDGGSAAHINLADHPSYEQCKKLMKFAAEEGCQYFTFNIPNSECQDCGWIGKRPTDTCPKCGSHHVDQYDRIIGYLTRIKNWADARKIEQTTRVYSKVGV